MANPLETLIKLQKTYVDEQQKQLAIIMRRYDDIEREIAAFEIQKATEMITVQENPDTGLTYAEFVKWAVKHSQELEKQRQATAQAVDIARARLAELFEEQKRYELAEERRIAEVLKVEQKLETNEMDEIGSVSFERKRRE